jgi:hypothetical protein
MKPYYSIVALLIGLFFTNKASGQVYVYAREDKADIIQNFNIEEILRMGEPKSKSSWQSAKGSGIAYWKPIHLDMAQSFV